MGPANTPCADGQISPAMAGGGGGAAIARDGREGGVGRLLVRSFNQGRCEVGVTKRLAKVSQGDPMAASGHGHVFGVDVDEVEGSLLHLFDHGRGCKVAVGEVLAWIGHDGGQEQGSWMMGSRW